MELIEFKEAMLGDIQVAAEAELGDTTSEFIRYVTELLIDSEEIDDFTECYFSIIGRWRKKVQIDGYHFDEVDKTCVIVICDFSNELKLSTLNNGQIDTLYEKMKGFVTNALDGYISTHCEESSLGYSFARDIQERFNEISKFRFYIFTDSVLSKNVKNIKKDPIEDKPVDLNIWDITRLYNIAISKTGKESIEINFKDFGISGLPCVKAVTSIQKEYESYLAVIRGDVLAKIYLEHGARLLEGNVRSFLSIRGKVNKEIRKTILNEEEMFFAYNNGIAATATTITYEVGRDGLEITSAKDLQIINGGQTTACIANAILQDKKDVSNIFIAMKLSVVNHDIAEEIIPIISRCANSQNKVDEADFFSNHPFHIRMEEHSRKTFAPAINGNQYQTLWFYERARGQHVQEQMKLTSSQRTKYLLKNPKSQVIKKVDLAKYVNTYWCRPHQVSKGAQASMRAFATTIEERWRQSDVIYNAHYYKKVVCLAILYKHTEKIISNQKWYQEVKSYRANVVTYSLSIIFYYIRTQLKGKQLDFKRIWNNQTLYPELEEQLIITTKEVYDFITSPDRPTQNVTEWCKKEGCWQRAQKVEWNFNNDFKKTLIMKSEDVEEQVRAKKEQRLENDINTEIAVIQLGEKYWKKVYGWGVEQKVLTPIDMDFLKIVCSFEESGKMPSSRQAKKILEIREKLILEGLPRELVI